MLGSRVILSVARAAGVAGVVGRSTSNAYAQTPDTVVSRAAEPPTRANEITKTETHSIALIRARTLRDEGLTRAKAYRNRVLELLQARLSQHTRILLYVCMTATECSSCCRRASLSKSVYCCMCVCVSSYCWILILLYVFPHSAGAAEQTTARTLPSSSDASWRPCTHTTADPAL